MTLVKLSLAIHVVDKKNETLDDRPTLEAPEQCVPGTLQYFIVPFILSTACHTTGSRVLWKLLAA